MAIKYFDPTEKDYVTQADRVGYSGVTSAGAGTYVTKTLGSGNPFHISAAVYVSANSSLWVRSGKGDWYRFTDYWFKWRGHLVKAAWRSTPGGGQALWLQANVPTTHPDHWVLRIWG